MQRKQGSSSGSLRQHGCRGLQRRWVGVRLPGLASLLPLAPQHPCEQQARSWRDYWGRQSTHSAAVLAVETVATAPAAGPAGACNTHTHTHTRWWLGSPIAGQRCWPVNAGVHRWAWVTAGPCTARAAAVSLGADAIGARTMPGPLICTVVGVAGTAQCFKRRRGQPPGGTPAGRLCSFVANSQGTINPHTRLQGPNQALAQRAGRPLGRPVLTSAGRRLVTAAARPTWAAAWEAMEEENAGEESPRCQVRSVGMSLVRPVSPTASLWPHGPASGAAGRYARRRRRWRGRGPPVAPAARPRSDRLRHRQRLNVLPPPRLWLPRRYWDAVLS